jgi:hypothetical protein
MKKILRSESRFVTCAMIGFWFAGLSIIGYVRFFMRAFRDSTFNADISAWLWLAGAIILSLIGIYAIVREVKRAPSSGH